MSTLRVAHREKFTVIDNALAQRLKISMRCKGMMLDLLSRPDDWEVSISHLVTIMLEGRYVILGTINKLRELGYIHRQKMGFRGGWRYWVFEAPTSEEEFKKFLRTMQFLNSSEIDPLLNTNIHTNDSSSSPTPSQDRVPETEVEKEEVLANEPKQLASAHVEAKPPEKAQEEVLKTDQILLTQTVQERKKPLETSGSINGIRMGGKPSCVEIDAYRALEAQKKRADDMLSETRYILEKSEKIPFPSQPKIPQVKEKVLDLSAPPTREEAEEVERRLTQREAKCGKLEPGVKKAWRKTTLQDIRESSGKKIFEKERFNRHKAQAEQMDNAGTHSAIDVCLTAFSNCLEITHGSFYDRVDYSASDEDWCSKIERYFRNERKGKP